MIQNCNGCHIYPEGQDSCTKQKKTPQNTKLIIKILFKNHCQKKCQEAVYEPTDRRHSCSFLYLMWAHCFKLIFIQLHNFLFFKQKNHTHIHTKETVTKKIPNKQTKIKQNKNPRGKKEFARLTGHNQVINIYSNRELELQGARCS